MGDRWFYSFDGDQVGRRLQICFLENDIEGMRALSNSVSSALGVLTEILEALGCEVIFAGGDSVLAVGPSRIMASELPTRFGCLTFSVGVGSSPKDALIALAKAKTRGSGAVVFRDGK